ncbi:MAG: hypothetical protein V3U80_09765 [Flavobacteriaceae bacterium]
MKKVALILVFIFAIASLSSCRSSKSTCTKVNTQEILQAPQQDVVVACVEVE